MFLDNLYLVYVTCKGMFLDNLNITVYLHTQNVNE